MVGDNTLFPQVKITIGKIHSQYSPICYQRFFNNVVMANGAKHLDIFTS
jgi:hypothetical protein